MSNTNSLDTQAPMYDRDKRKAVDLANTNQDTLQSAAVILNELTEETCSKNQQWHEADHYPAQAIMLLVKAKMIKLIRFNDGKNYAALWLRA